MPRSHYDVLQLDSQKASHDEIKRAFRRLSMEMPLQWSLTASNRTSDHPKNAFPSQFFNVKLIKISFSSQTQFENLNQKTSKDVYTQLTCATDSNNIRFVFDVITDLLVRENLKSCGLFQALCDISARPITAAALNDLKSV